MANVKRDQMYECNECGNIVEVTKSGGGELVCCGKPMKLLVPKTADAVHEKHVPMIEKQAGGYRVTVGSTLHPMTEEHYIEWIELNMDGTRYRKHLKPGDKPEAFFCCACDGEEISAEEHCNIHGLWGTK